jgi:hypothetical protein
MVLLRSAVLSAQPQQVLDRITSFLGIQRLRFAAAPVIANGGGGEAAGVDPTQLLQLREALDPRYRKMAERYGIMWPG